MATTYADLKKYTENISGGILDVIASYNLINELENGKNTSFAPNLMSLMKQEWSWALHNPDLLSEMLAEVYIRVFVTRAKTVFGTYVPKGQKGHEAPLENWLHFILKRAYQEISKIKYGEMKKYKEINVLDGQSMDDAIDNIVLNNTKVRTTQDFSNRMEDINGYIGWFEERVQHLIKESPHDTKRLAYYKKKIEELEEEANLLEKEMMFDKDKKYDDKDEIEHPMSHDEKMFFDRMTKDLQDIIKNGSTNPEPQIKVFKLLIDDYSPSEIARIMEVSSAKISQRISKLKDSLKELAEKYKEDGDSDLYNSLSRLMNGKGRRQANRIQHVK